MKRLVVAIMILLESFSTGLSQPVNVFINNYKEAFDAKYSYNDIDSTMIFIPAIMNLIEKSAIWESIPLSERRKRVLDFISYPILAYSEMIDLITGERYIYPEGMIYKDNGLPTQPNHFCGPTPHDTWYYNDIQVPLYVYLRRNRPEYVFTIPNLGVSEYYCGYFWIIKDDLLYALVFDTNLCSFYPIEVHVFLNHIAEDDYFKTLSDY